MTKHYHISKSKYKGHYTIALFHIAATNFNIIRYRNKTEITSFF